MGTVCDVVVFRQSFLEISVFQGQHVIAVKGSPAERALAEASLHHSCNTRTAAYPLLLVYVVGSGVMHQPPFSCSYTTPYQVPCFWQLSDHKPRNRPCLGLAIRVIHTVSVHTVPEVLWGGVTLAV